MAKEVTVRLGSRMVSLGLAWDSEAAVVGGRRLRESRQKTTDLTSAPLDRSHCHHSDIKGSCCSSITPSRLKSCWIGGYEGGGAIIQPRRRRQAGIQGKPKYPESLSDPVRRYIRILDNATVYTYTRPQDESLIMKSGCSSFSDSSMLFISALSSGSSSFATSRLATPASPKMVRILKTVAISAFSTGARFSADSNAFSSTLLRKIVPSS